jgi:hypothetical protein
MKIIRIFEGHFCEKMFFENLRYFFSAEKLCSKFMNHYLICSKIWGRNNSLCVAECVK